MIGELLRVSLFGESHGTGVGVLLIGFPHGLKIDYALVEKELGRRRPGFSALASKRKEQDSPEFLSGVFKGKTNGNPIAAIVKNTDTDSSHYEQLMKIPRPGHADYPSILKFGDSWDYRGSGFSSGRLTAGLVIAGALCKQALKEKFKTEIKAALAEVAGSKDKKQFAKIIKKAAAEKDSVGAVITCTANNVPFPLGSPICGLDGELAHGMFCIPGVRGFTIGTPHWTGSENNDQFRFQKGKVCTKTNNSGGVLGGMTFGNSVVANVLFKPTSSIGKEQDSVDLERKTNAKLAIIGRHDPCIAVRGLPVVEAVMAIVLMDNVLKEGIWTGKSA